jgi:predicted nucleotidyltransferase
VVKNREEVLNILKQNKETIKQFGVRRLGLFGSFAQGQEKAGSDLDFLVEFDHKSFDAYMDLKEYLENLFQRPVDLILPNVIKPRLRSRILEAAVHAPGL